MFNQNTAIHESSHRKAKEAPAHIQTHKLNSPVKHTEPHFAGSFSDKYFTKLKEADLQSQRIVYWGVWTSS
jgi:hypothetical protein